MNGSSLWIVLHRMRVPLLVLISTYTISIIGFLIIQGIDANGHPYHMSIFDAFYVVTYTATTIGFGELPYEFTYAQRIWMSMTIYAIVLGWFYSIGTLVALFQDKFLIAQLTESRFLKQVRNMKQHFLIVLGYNHITSEIIKKANKDGIRTIVIEKDQLKVDELNLENFTPSVPCLVADVYDPIALEKAGMNSPYCKAVVSLFQDDTLNLRVAITTKYLNKKVKVAVKTTRNSITEDLRDLEVEVVENPFEIIAEQVEMSLKYPHLLIVQKWLYDIEPLNANTMILPKGQYVVCGFGRLGKKLFDIFKLNAIKAIFIEPDEDAIKDLPPEYKKDVLIGRADDKRMLLMAEIFTADVLFAGTDDDMKNLSIITAARQLNPTIKVIARENKIEDMSLFNNAKIDMLFIPSKVLIHKTIHSLISPYSSKFFDMLKAKKDDEFAKQLIQRLTVTIGSNPILFGMAITYEKSLAIYNAIANDKKTVTMEVYKRSRKNTKKTNKVIPLILLRGKEQFLLPEDDTILQINDRILFASDEETKNDIEYIAQNFYEFHYVLTGKEKSVFKNILEHRKG